MPPKQKALERLAVKEAEMLKKAEEEEERLRQEQMEHHGRNGRRDGHPGDSNGYGVGYYMYYPEGSDDYEDDPNAIFPSSSPHQHALSNLEVSEEEALIATQRAARASALRAYIQQQQSDPSSMLCTILFHSQERDDFSKTFSQLLNTQASDMNQIYIEMKSLKFAHVEQFERMIDLAVFLTLSQVFDAFSRESVMEIAKALQHTLQNKADILTLLCGNNEVLMLLLFF